MKNAILFSLMLISIVGCQSNKQFSEKMKEKIEHDVKRDDIIGRMHLFFREIDNQNWDRVLKVLASEVEFDLGNGPEKMSAEKAVSIWKEKLKGFDGVHHQVSNYGIEVDDRTAKLLFVGTNTLHKTVKKRSFINKSYGSYEVKMIQPEGDETNWEWKISRFIYKKKFTSDK